MDGVVEWKTAAKGRVWEDVGLHVAHGRATAAQRPQQVQIYRFDGTNIAPLMVKRWLCGRWDENESSCAATAEGRRAR
jgi:hypothetical protein